MPPVVFARFNESSRVPGMSLAWDAKAETFSIPELGKAVTIEGVEAMLKAKALDVTDRAVLDAAMDVFYETLTPAGEATAGLDPARRRPVLLLAAAILVAFAAGGLAGYLLPSPLDAAAPEPPAVATQTPEPTATPEYSPDAAREAVLAYYGDVADKDWDSVAAATGLDATSTASLAKSSGYSASVSSTDVSLPSYPTTETASGVAYADFTESLAGRVSVSMLGTGFPASGWVRFDPATDGYSVVDRVLPVSAARATANTYEKRTGKTVVTLSVSDVFSNPWASVCRLGYVDNGSEGGQPIVLANPSGGTGPGEWLVSWASLESSWTVPHRMPGMATTSYDSPPDATGTVPPKGDILPRAERQGTNVMPTVRFR